MRPLLFKLYERFSVVSHSICRAVHLTMNLVALTLVIVTNSIVSSSMSEVSTTSV